MGQKTNPNIFRLGKTKEWTSKYFEIKQSELPTYTFNDLEIKNFIRQFFKYNNFQLSKCIINYYDNKLDILIYYYVSLEALNTNNGKLKTEVKNIKKLYNFKIMQQKKLQNDFSTNLKKKFLNWKQFKTFNLYNKYLNNIYHYQITSSYRLKFFIEIFLESLNQFSNKKLDIIVNCCQLNLNTKQTLNKQTLNFITKNTVQLRKYQQSEFFKEGINIIFAVIHKNKSTDLLAQYITNKLKSLKRHNFFLSFVKAALSLFYIKKLSKQFKIKIKGRFNGAPRARSKIILIGNVPVVTLNVNISYIEKTAYTKNGTFGVKIWTYQK